MKNTKITSMTAILVMVTMLAGCATPNGSGSMAQGDPCQPNADQSFFTPATTSFIEQAILSPLAKIGGTLLATAAANYSGKYSGKLNKLLTKLVTPKKKKEKEPAQQPVDPGYPYNDQGYQPDYGYENQIDPNTGYPIQDPNTGYPTDPYAQQGYPQDPYGEQPAQPDYPTDPYAQQGYPGQDNFGQPQGQIDPNTGFPLNPGIVDQGQFEQGLPQEEFPVDPNIVDQGQFQEGFPQEGVPVEPGFEDQGQFQTFEEGIPQEPFDPNVQGDVQPRGIPGQLPHATFPSEPCHPQQQVQGYPPGNQPNQPYGNDPAYQTGGYDPYGQQQAQNPYGQTDPYAQQPAQQDPYAQQAYPNDPYNQQGHPTDPTTQQGYPQDPTAQTEYLGQGTANGTPIGLDVMMVKKTMRNGAVVMLPINDGDVLKDGRGNAQVGDKFRIMFRPQTDGYVYVVAIDGSGWAQGIFPPPTSPLANPVKAGQEYTLPEGKNWFSLDQFKGIETIFFVASQEKRQDLEEVLQSITGHERPATETPQQVTKVAMVPYGVGGARPSTKGFNLPEGSGAGQTIMPTSYFSKTAGEDLRLTRWFRHE